MCNSAYLQVACAVDWISQPSQTLLRWHTDDVTEQGPPQPENGVLPVPDEPGLGVTLDRVALIRCSSAMQSRANTTSSRTRRALDSTRPGRRRDELAFKPPHPSLTEYLLGVDLGTSSAKALIVDIEGSLVGQAGVGYPMFHPRPAWAEHDPTDFYEAVVAAVRAVLQATEVPVGSVAGLAIVAQREPPVMLNERLEPCAPSISWTDQRSAPDIQRFAERIGRERYMDVAGLLPNAGSTLASLLWMQRCTPDVLREARHLLFPKDYVLFRLTGEMLTDPSTPGRSSLWISVGSTGQRRSAQRAGVELKLLPGSRLDPLTSGGHSVHKRRASLGCQRARRWQLGVVTIRPPRSAEERYTKVIFAGTGTASSWRIVSDQRIPDREGRTELAPHVIRDVVIREASITGTGSSMRWFRDNLMPDISMAAREAGEDPYARLIRLAEQADPERVACFSIRISRARWCPASSPMRQGVFFGITGGVERRHLIRAVIEGITFQYALTVEMLRSSGEAIDFITVVDGEAESRMWSQLKADVIGIEVRVPRSITRAAGLGAAILAGLATGVFATVEDAAQAMIADHESFRADMPQHDQYKEIITHPTPL